MTAPGTSVTAATTRSESASTIAASRARSSLTWLFMFE